jgi:hypothetical protein
MSKIGEKVDILLNNIKIEAAKELEKKNKSELKSCNDLVEILQLFNFDFIS